MMADATIDVRLVAREEHHVWRFIKSEWIDPASGKLSNSAACRISPTSGVSVNSEALACVYWGTPADAWEKFRQTQPLFTWALRIPVSTISRLGAIVVFVPVDGNRAHCEVQAAAAAAVPKDADVIQAPPRRSYERLSAAIYTEMMNLRLFKCTDII
jgi:hypothetical protein